MATKKRFANEATDGATKNLDFFKFEKEGEKTVFLLGAKTSVKIDGETLETFELIEEETGGKFIAPTNVNLQKKLNNVAEILKDVADNEKFIEIEYTGKKKFEGSNFPTKVFAVRY